MTARSYLYAPGDQPRLLEKVFRAGADVVVLDLEDGVPRDRKAEARDLVGSRIVHARAWVRVNAPRTGDCERDLDAVASLASGLRVPKVESGEDVDWIAERAGSAPLICGIESARGILAAPEIARSPGVAALALGGVDLIRELDLVDGELELLHARSQLVLASAAAGIGAPIDRVHPRLHDPDDLRQDARAARRLGFGGKSAVHPRQLAAIHEVFSPTPQELVWAHEVVDAFAAAGQRPTSLAGGEFVDLPVALRASALLERAGDERVQPMRLDTADQGGTG